MGVFEAGGLWRVKIGRFAPLATRNSQLQECILPFRTWLWATRDPGPGGGRRGERTTSFPGLDREPAMYDLVVIGGGSGGLNVAMTAAQVGARVALIEKERPGGECTFTACVPSKGLVQAAKLAHQVRGAGLFGLRTGPLEVDFPAVMQRIHSVVEGIAVGESPEVLRARGIDVYHGSAAFAAYDTVGLDDGTLIPGRRFVI